EPPFESRLTERALRTAQELIDASELRCLAAPGLPDRAPQPREIEDCPGGVDEQRCGYGNGVCAQLSQLFAQRTSTGAQDLGKRAELGRSGLRGPARRNIRLRLRAVAPGVQWFSARARGEDGQQPLAVERDQRFAGDTPQRCSARNATLHGDRRPPGMVLGAAIENGFDGAFAALQ